VYCSGGSAYLSLSVDVAMVAIVRGVERGFVWFGKRWYCGRRGSELQEIAMCAVEELSEHTSLLLDDILTSPQIYFLHAIESVQLFRWTSAFYIKNKSDDTCREPHEIARLAHEKASYKVSLNISI
jgi:hypothetical protein